MPRTRRPPAEPYRPANFVEAMAFNDAWCCRCRNYEGEDGCALAIFEAATLFDVGEPDYPPELVHDADGQPECTAFLPE